jgi:NAD-dependent glycerol-3-phosphate dehydrogenase C-terminus
MGQGETAAQIQASTQEVAEGVDTAKALVSLIHTKCKGSYRLELKYPILLGIADILEGKQTPEEGLEALMDMPVHMENFDERSYDFDNAPRVKRVQEEIAEFLQEEGSHESHGTVEVYDEHLAKLEALARDLRDEALGHLV